MRVLTLILAALLISSCSTYRFPGVHRITIQQGNVITQQMVDKLRPGMTRSQVKFVLGNPIVDDPFKLDRWEYYYSIQVAGGDLIHRVLRIHFIDNRLSYFDGDFAPTSNLETAKATP